MEATPTVSAPRPSRKSPASLPRASSPTMRSRLEEKEELQNLNDRLAVYIDKMRFLEETNSSLTAEINSWKKKEESESSAVKNMYEEELTNARKLLDEICKEKSRIELENTRNFASLKDFQKRFDQEQKAATKANEQNTLLKKQVSDLEAALANLTSDNSNLKKQFDDVKKEKENVQDLLDSTRHELEELTLAKVDLENRMQTLTEDLNFRKRSFETEISEMKQQMTSFESKRVYMETDYKQKYDTIMKDKLQELREEFEDEAENIKNDVENTYKQKLDDLRNNSDKTRDECSHQLVIIRDLKSSIETFKIENSVLEKKVTSLKEHINEIERLRINERDDFDKQLKDKTDEIQDLHCALDDKDKEYEALMGVKIALDLEISAYRKLLEGEEERLNITPTVTPSRKRPRMESDESLTDYPIFSTAKGSINFVDSEPSGQYVKLKNVGGNEEPLGGWIIRRTSDGKEPVEFKFSPRSIIKAGTSVSIWSASSGTKHKPPTDLVMKSSDWGPGPSAVTTLHNSEGDVVAQMTETGASAPGSKGRSRRKRPHDKNESCVIS